MICHYCHQTAQDAANLRPYGPGGALICHPCGSSPEHRAETVRNMGAHLDAVLAAAERTGAAVLLGEGAPRVSAPAPKGMQ